MKILVQGNTSWQKEVTCSHCRATLLVEASDIHKAYRKEYDQRDGEYMEEYYYYKCACCHLKNTITIPSWAMEIIQYAIHND